MTPAEYQALKEEILFGPKASLCAPYVVLPSSGKDLLGYQKDTTIATILSEGRAPKIVSKEVGDGAICLALGTPAGPVFVYQLRKLATTILPADAPYESIAQVAIADQAVRSMEKVGLDVGNTEVRAGLDMFIGNLLTAEQVAAIKAIAEVPDVITADDVSRALRGPWE